MCHNHEWRIYGFADVDVWQSSNLPDPIKPKAVRVIWLISLLVTFLPTSPILAMSFVNNRTFKHSMGHQISCQDACFHLHTSDGQHYPSNQQVRHRQDSALLSLTGVLVVGGLGTDARCESAVWALVD